MKMSQYQDPQRGGVWIRRSCLVSPVSIYLAPLREYIDVCVHWWVSAALQPNQNHSCAKLICAFMMWIFLQQPRWNFPLFPWHVPCEMTCGICPDMMTWSDTSSLWITRISGSLKFSTLHAMAVPVTLSAPLDLPLHGCMAVMENAFRTGKRWSRHILCYPQKFTWETGRQGRLLFQRLKKSKKLARIGRSVWSFKSLDSQNFMHFYELFFRAPQLLARHRDNQISRCHEIFQKPCVVSWVSLQNGKLFAWYQLTGNHDLTAVKESVHKWILPEATVCTVFVWFEHIDNMGVSVGSVALNCHWKQWNEYTWTEELVWKPWIQSEKTPWTKQHQRGWQFEEKESCHSHVSHVMKLRKDRLSDEVPRIDSTGAGNCARINTLAPLGMQICMICKFHSSHALPHGNWELLSIPPSPFAGVLGSRHCFNGIADCEENIPTICHCGVAPLPIGCGITCKFPLQELISLRRLKNVELHQAERRQKLRWRKRLERKGWTWHDCRKQEKTTKRLTFGCRFQDLRWHSNTWQVRNPFQSPLICSASGVSVYGSVTYAELCPLLQEHGFAIPNLASLPHISVARQSHISRRVGMKFCQSRLLEP